MKIISISCTFVLLGSWSARATTLKSIPTNLSPTKAYVLVEYKRTPNPFAGTPLAPKYLPQMGGLVLGRYDVIAGDIRGFGKASANPVPQKAGPTEFFQNKPVVKTETAQLYLLEIEPDYYVVQGWANTSFSLGSYRFDAKPGTVVDLGIVSAAPDWPGGEGPKPLTAGRLAGIILSGPFQKAPPVAPARVAFRPRGIDDIPLPSGLASEHVLPVSFEYGSTFGNYLGGPVNRIDGVNAKRAHADASIEAAGPQPTPAESTSK